MECLILTAGAGSRLLPLTRRVPKPLLPLGRSTIVARLIEQVTPLPLNRVLCNLHFGAEAAQEYFTHADLGLPVLTRTEDRLRGPAGSMLTFHDELAATDTALVLSGDLYLRGDLPELVRRHHETKSDLTVLAVEVDDGSRFGVFELDSRGRPVTLREKPASAAGRRSWISGGAYCVNPALLARIPHEGLYDFGAHLIPRLLEEGGNVSILPWLGTWDDLGTIESYRRAVLQDVDEVGRPGPDGAISYVAPTARVHPSAHLTGRVHIAEHALVEAESHLHNTVVLPGATVHRGVVVADGCVS